MAPETPFQHLMERLQDGDEGAARAVFERYARRLVSLAGSRLPRLLAAKVDAEDVVQSVFKSFFARQQNAQFSLANWDELWTVLTVLTVRKCGHRVRHFRTGRRDAARETQPVSSANQSSLAWQPAAAEPSADEAFLLAETLAEVLQTLKPAHRQIVQLRLQGFTVEEISTQIPCTERTIYRVLDKVRMTLSEEGT